MPSYSTRQAAQMLGISLVTLQRYIAKGLVSVPALKLLGGGRFREWTDRDIKRIRKQLPGIRNGRKKKAS